jgi:hypothetical protein
MKGVGLGVFLPERGAGSQCGFAGEGVVEEISLGYSACRLAKGGPVNRPGLSRHLMTAIGRLLPVTKGCNRLWIQPLRTVPDSHTRHVWLIIEKYGSYRLDSPRTPCPRCLNGTTSNEAATR